MLVLVAAQAVWVTILCRRGWFYTDDFGYLAVAKHHSLGWGYLTAPSGDHLAPGLWLIFWFLVRVGGLHYGVSIAVRVVLQAVATVLLYRLLVQVSGARRGVLAILVVYAASPLLVPGTMWLTNALELLPAQICAIIAYDAHIRRWRGGSLRTSLVTGAALFIGMCFWEKTGVTALVLVALTAGWLTSGGPLTRWRAMTQDWRGWLCALGPAAGFTAYFIAKGYGSSAQRLPLHVVVHLDWLQWSHSVWPTVIGAPWRWYGPGLVFQSITAPGHIAVTLGQVAFLALVAIGWYRRRWSGALAWVLPILSVAVGEVLVAIGRYAAFGGVPAVALNYAFDVAVPMTLAATLTFWDCNAGQSARGRAGSRAGETAPRRRAVSTRPRAATARSGAGWVVIGLLLPAIVVSGVVSSMRWTDRFQQSPAKAYTATLVSSIHALGPDAVFYNAPVTHAVMPALEPDHNLSDFLDLAGVSATFNTGPTPPLVVDHTGHPVVARFVTAASAGAGRAGRCVATLSGPNPVTVRLRPREQVQAYFVRLGYHDLQPSRVAVETRNAAGELITLDGSRIAALDQARGRVVLQLGIGSPRTITFTGQQAMTEVCLTSVAVGLPVPARR